MYLQSCPLTNRILRPVVKRAVSLSGVIFLLQESCGPIVPADFLVPRPCGLPTVLGNSLFPYSYVILGHLGPGTTLYVLSPYNKDFFSFYWWKSISDLRPCEWSELVGQSLCNPFHGSISLSGVSIPKASLLEASGVQNDVWPGQTLIPKSLHLGQNFCCDKPSVMKRLKYNMINNMEYTLDHRLLL